MPEREEPASDGPVDGLPAATTRPDPLLDAPGADAPGADAPGGEGAASDWAIAASESAAIERPPATPPPKRSVFSLEGRAAPGLYAAGWALTILGVAVLLVFLAAKVPASTAASLVALGAFVALGLGTLAGAGAQALQRRADGWQTYWGPSPWLVLVSLFAAMIVVQAVVDRVIGLFGIASATPTGTLVVLLAYVPMYAGIVHLVVVAPGALTWAEIRRPRRLAKAAAPIAPELGPSADGRERRRDDLLGDIVWGVTMLAVTIPATILALDIAVAIFGNPPVVSPLPQTHTATDSLLNLITAGVLAPIGEEIFFRGFVTDAWARTMPIRRAIVQAALVFAFVHILSQTDGRAAAIAFIGRIPVAIALSWVYLRRGSLYASVAHHAGYNTFLTLLAWSVTAG